jgi:hypothetical protein
MPRVIYVEEPVEQPKPAAKPVPKPVAAKPLPVQPADYGETLGLLEQAYRGEWYISARAWLGATRGFHDLGTDAGKMQQAVGAAPSGAVTTISMPMRCSRVLISRRSSRWRNPSAAGPRMLQRGRWPGARGARNQLIALILP